MTTFKTLYQKAVIILILIIGFYSAIAQLSLNFSEERGFPDNPFHLKVTSPQTDNIKYTLDGSMPDLKSLNMPDSLAINSNTVVRVLAYNTTDTLQETHTYLFLDEIVNQSN